MNLLARVFVRTNAALFQFSGGRLGSQLGAQSVLLLHTIGRKTGKAYATPLSYYRDGERYLVVASNWGEEAHPSWYRNLMAAPRTTIQTKDGLFTVVARRAEEEEYQRLWQFVTRQNAQYLNYQQGIKRQIPIVILTPV